MNEAQYVALGFALAEADRGVHEEGGDNRGERVQSYLEGASIWVPAAWCAAFVDYCIDKATRALGKSNPFSVVQLEAYVQDYADKLKDKEVDPLKAKPGDLVLFSFGGQRWDHMGFVLSPVDHGMFRTVEGNTSDQNQREGDSVAVKRRTLATGRRKPMFIGWE